ncbi:hypothetical protein 2AV2_101 [Nodularia phage vB_NpeS-2AV2]|uniref:Uncharacterized protein n=1 Tax=Nodularia phage vB_NpeS-2AV2 TaxID=1777122 RepID=A0A1L2BWZ9_9CAUD|nr:hypothetical protein HWA92_gp101 [Nodularia phage vB_NpeS-2AV2]ALY07553.1 hypothetical protein 2AV2_101 [Nodularia phage vB_NpeS-2AV2]
MLKAGLLWEIWLYSRYFCLGAWAILIQYNYC